MANMFGLSLPEYLIWLEEGEGLWWTCWLGQAAIIAKQVESDKLEEDAIKAKLPKGTQWMGGKAWEGSRPDDEEFGY